MRFHETIKGVNLEFETDKSLFSPAKVDDGTRALLNFIDFKNDDFILDLGCGYGVVGILAAKIIGENRVVMIDKDPKAIEYSKINSKLNGVGEIKVLKSDGLENLNEIGFTKIISNPPYHVDFSIPKRFIEKGFNRLKIGGEIYMVTKRRKWYKNKIISIFGGVKIKEHKGYHIFIAEKRSNNYANK